MFVEKLELEGALNLSHGIIFLNSIKNKLLALHTTHILSLLGHVGTCLHQNGESVNQLNIVTFELYLLMYQTFRIYHDGPISGPINVYSTWFSLWCLYIEHYHDSLCFYQDELNNEL